VAAGDGVEVCSARMAGWLLHGSLQVYTPPSGRAHGCLLCDMSSGACLVCGCVWLSGRVLVRVGVLRVLVRVGVLRVWVWCVVLPSDASLYIRYSEPQCGQILAT
jgi:hypothetical protein